MEKWIIDTDAGIDDAQAVFLALNYLDVVAITCVGGNAHVEDVVKNVSIIVGLCKSNVPIYKGMAIPLVEKALHIADIHGSDGFGNCQEKYKDWIQEQNIQEEHAALAIIKHVNEEYEKGNKPCIATIGPLTNLAMAIRLDSTLPDKVEKFYCMGGTYKGWGNITYGGEYNFMYDPEAAHIVIKSMKMTHLLPWETAYDFNITKKDRELLSDQDYERCQLFADINKINDSIDGRIYCCDGLCMAAAIEPSIVQKSNVSIGKVELEGKSTRGALMFNMYPLFIPDQDAPNVTQLIEIDHDRYVELLNGALKNTPVQLVKEVEDISSRIEEKLQIEESKECEVTEVSA